MTSSTDAKAIPDGSASPGGASYGHDRRVELRETIAAEILRQDAYPVARRTLQFLAEGAVEPIADAPGYRIVDRAGTPRLHVDAQGRESPLTLAASADELRARHPALFVPRPPAPAIVPAATPAPAVSPADEIKAATARFVDTQSALARSAMAQSASRGQAIATSAATAWAGMRTRLADRMARSSTATDAPPRTDPLVGLRDRGGRVGEAVRVRTRNASDGLRQRLGGLAEAALRIGTAVRVEDGPRRVLARPSVLVGAGLVGILGLLAVVAVRNGGDTPTEPTKEPTGELTRRPATTNVPDIAAAPPAATIPVPDLEEASPPPEDAAPPAPKPNEVSGQADVIDTATLRVGGKLVRLFGVEWVRGGQSDELRRYLAGRPVTCQPVAGSQAFLCGVEGRDLSEVVLFNGGGHASSEATPDLVAAEDRARTERLGVWAR